MHSYYVTNSKTEVKYAYKEFDNEKFEEIIKETIYSLDNNEEYNINDEDEDFNEEFNEKFNEEEIERDDEMAVQINET